MLLKDVYMGWKFPRTLKLDICFSLEHFFMTVAVFTQVASAPLMVNFIFCEGKCFIIYLIGICKMFEISRTSGSSSAWNLKNKNFHPFLVSPRVHWLYVLLAVNWKVSSVNWKKPGRKLWLLRRNQWKQKPNEGNRFT